MTRMTISERIVLHLSRYDILCEGEFNVPWDLTQDGVAASLRISRAHSSIELKKLKEAGKVDEFQGHVKGCKMKRKSYRLAPAGMEDAKQLKTFAENEGWDIMPMLDMKRCDPRALWDSVDEEDRDAFGLACVFRCSVLRADIPETTKPVIPADANGMIALSDSVKENALSAADGERVRRWHSMAADHWLDKDDPQERLHHLVCAGRTKDACRLVINEKERLLYNINDDLFDILSKMNVPGKYALDVLPMKITAAIESGDAESSASLIDELMELDEDLALLYSADLEMKKGDHSKALSIIRSINKTDRFDVSIRAAGALGHLGRTEEAMDILDAVKSGIVGSGTVDGLDRVYIQMAGVCAASKDADASIKYLTKALGAAGEDGKKRIYGMLAALYESEGMKDKAKECSARSNVKITCSS